MLETHITIPDTATAVIIFTQHRCYSRRCKLQYINIQDDPVLHKVRLCFVPATSAALVIVLCCLHILNTEVRRKVKYDYVSCLQPMLLLLLFYAVCIYLTRRLGAK